MGYPPKPGAKLPLEVVCRSQPAQEARVVLLFQCNSSVDELPHDGQDPPHRLQQPSA